MDLSEAFMYFAWAVVVVLVVFKLLRRRPPLSGPAPGRRHFTEVTDADGWFAITAVPAPPTTPFAVAALLPAVAAAVVLTALWVAFGHSFEASAWFFWITLTLGVVVFRPMAQRRDHRIRNIQPAPFHVRHAEVRLPTGEELFINGMYAVTRRNSAPYGHPSTASAHHVDLDLDGVTYVLAGGMDDQSSMAVYHQVLRRLKGEP